MDAEHSTQEGKFLSAIANFECDQPCSILNWSRPDQKCPQIYVWLPRAITAWIEDETNRIDLKPVLPKGFFSTLSPQPSHVSSKSYLCFTDSSGYISRRRNPYAFSPQLSREDIYLYGEGKSCNSYRKFGAHALSFGEVPGVQFVVWAPNAKAVSIVGNFNHWTAGEHPMQRMHESGYWALFIPDLNAGEYYKLAIKTQQDYLLEKSDPYAFSSELRPHTASVVVSAEAYSWKDHDWIAKRAKKNFMKEPMSVYEVHLGSWMRTGEGGAQFLDYRSLAHKLVEHVKRLGFTHIELMPVMEHPLDQSWGYQVLGYFSPTRRFGMPNDFRYFVEYFHLHDIGVLLDWVPAHFPKDEHGLNNFDGQQIYAYQDWQRGEHQDWGTLVFDYGRGEVRSFLISSAMYWIDEFHLDGLRVDAVASMIYLDYSREYGQWNPNKHGGNENLEAIEFVKDFNEAIHKSFPGVLTIAEESTAYPCVSRPTWMNGLGFSMKWNMGWMHDSLTFFSKNPIHRRWHMNDVTFPLIYAFHENFVLPISHDEVVHGKQSLLHKMPGDEWQQAANFRLYLGYMYSQPGKKLLFMGQEFAQGNEWNSNQSLDWHVMEYKRHYTADRLTADVNRLYKEVPALHQVDFEAEGFEWVDFNDPNSTIISYLRYDSTRNDVVLVVLNLTPVPRVGYRIGVPKPGVWHEILNTDSEWYGGSNCGNAGVIHAENIPSHRKDFSLNLAIPPLSTIWIRNSG